MSQVFPQPTSGSLPMNQPPMPSQLLMPTPPSPIKSQNPFYLGTEVLIGAPFLAGYDYREDVNQIYNAVKGWGTKDKLLIQVRDKGPALRSSVLSF
jgi:hypothetical protein